MFLNIVLLKFIELSFFRAIKTKAVSFLNSKAQIFSRVNKILKIILIIYVLLICISKLVSIYDVPINKPYFTGGWDEPYSANAGINILHTKGDAQFYNYGGTSAIPYALAFLVYSMKHNIKPHYKFLNKKFYNPKNPIIRKIYPVKPIFLGRVVALIIFAVLTFVFVSLFTWYLLPLPFILLQMIDHSTILAGYKSYMMGNTHSALLAGITCVFFILTLLTNDFKKYKKYLFYTCIFSSITVAAKLNAAFIVLLPLSLLIHMYKNYDLSLIKGNKILLKVFGLLFIPYCLINPGLILNTGSYLGWLKGILVLQGGHSSFAWMDKTNQIFPFINDLYIIKYWPNMLLIILGLSAVMLMARISKIAFIFYVF
ncbi:hypothetical protein ACFL4O_03730, partial [bacterium]